MAVRRLDSPKQKWTRERKIGASLTVIPLLFVAVLEFFSHLTLASAVPLWLYCGAALCGAAYAVIIIGYLPDQFRERTLQNIVRQVSIVGLFSIAVMPYLFRQFLMLGGFAFLNPPTTIESFVIDGSLGRRGPDRLLLRPLDFEGRRVSIFVTPKLHARYFHISTHGIDCVALATQEGRGGMKRVYLPSRYERLAHDEMFGINIVVPNCSARNATALLNATGRGR